MAAGCGDRRDRNAEDLQVAAWIARTERSQLKLAARAGRGRQVAAQRLVLEHALEAVGDVLDAVGIDQQAASPTTSGSDEMREVTTGVPQAIASSGGRPKPSYSDGNAKTDARR